MEFLLCKNGSSLSGVLWWLRTQQQQRKHIQTSSHLEITVWGQGGNRPQQPRRRTVEDTGRSAQSEVRGWGMGRSGAAGRPAVRPLREPVGTWEALCRWRKVGETSAKAQSPVDLLPQVNEPRGPAPKGRQQLPNGHRWSPAEELRGGGPLRGSRTAWAGSECGLSVPVRWPL